MLFFYKSKYVYIKTYKGSKCKFSAELVSLVAPLWKFCKWLTALACDQIV